MHVSMIKLMAFIGAIFTIAQINIAHASSSPEIAALEQAIANQQTNSDHIWTMIAAALVLFMQLGFLLLEAGFVRSKNSVNVAQKNFVDLILSIVCFYCIGFGIMFGASQGGWWGSPFDLSFFNEVDVWNYTFFVFQAAFVGTAATIVSGAVAERMQFSGYIFASAIIALIIYPVFGHWAWGNLLEANNTAWLADAGFIDFAGSTVVHSIGAWVGLAGIIVLGPRIGKFNKDGSVNPIQGYSVVLGAAGALILLVGWFGFNGGSTTAGSPEFAKIIANTLLAAVFGGASSLILGYVLDRKYHPARCINGLLGGLVAITAGCDAVLPVGAVQIGFLAGFVVIASSEILERYFKLDDVLYAVSIHGTCGAFGTIAVAFFATQEKLAAATRWDQFVIQTEGVVLAFIWAFGIGFAMFKALDMTVGLRVSKEHEVIGLNTAEHGVTLGTGEVQRVLLSMMNGEQMDLTKELDEHSGDEAAEIAQIINPFLRRVRKLVSSIQYQASEVSEKSDKLDELSKLFVDGAGLVLNEADQTSQSAQSVDNELKSKTKAFGKMSSNSAEIASAAQYMAEQLTDVSATVEEMTYSINEVARNATNASTISTDVVRLTESATETTTTLQDAANQIQGIVTVISELAGKTNMLALNATIEAARAGEFGKGFSVVAEEVKSLANSTTTALSQIEERVERLLQGSDTVSTSVDEVSEIVKTMNDAIQTIVSTTQQQGSATQQISQSVNGVTSQVQEITERIGSLSSEINDGSNQVETIAKFANTLQSGSEQLRTEANSGLDNAHTVGGQVTDLNKISETLKQTVRAFKV